MIVNLVRSILFPVLSFCVDVINCVETNINIIIKYQTMDIEFLVIWLTLYRRCTTAQCIAPPATFLAISRQLFKTGVHGRTLLVFRSDELWVREQAYPRWKLSQKYCKLLRSRWSITPNLGNLQRYIFQTLRDKLLRKLCSVTRP